MRVLVIAQGNRWHLPALPTTLARLVLRTQARRKEKGPRTTPHNPCPYNDDEGFPLLGDLQANLYARNRGLDMTERTFSVIMHKEDDLYVAECPEVGTVSQAYTIEEAIANLKEATELYLEEFPWQARVSPEEFIENV
jgi:predicted RNase H-like HicB family nuclease